MTAGRRRLLALGFGAIALAAVYLTLSSGDEARILELLRALLRAAEVRPGESRALRRARRNAAFEAHLEPDAVLELPELDAPARGREAVGALAETLAGKYVSTRFKIEQTEIRASAAQISVTAAITLQANDGTSELLDTRQVTVQIQRSGGQLRVAAVSVGERSRAEPEARP